MPETTTRKNPDYTNSAVNLNNPKELEPLLADRRKLVEKRAQLEKELEASEVVRQIADVQKTIVALEDEIKIAVERHGSYQDVEKGVYAVKLRRVSVTYLPELVRQVIPDYAGAVIEETVNRQKIGGLLKGKLITPEQVGQVSESTETFSFIVR